MRVLINVQQIEFHEGGHTLWVHGPGGTVLRIKLLGGVFRTTRCGGPGPSHADLAVQSPDVTFRIGDDETDESIFAPTQTGS